MVQTLFPAARRPVDMVAIGKSGRKLFTSTLTDEEAQEVCKNLPSDFARKLGNSPLHTLTPNMIHWAHYMAVEHLKEQSGPKIDLKKVIELFDKAHEHLKYPRITVFSGDEKVKLVRAGDRSNHPGCVNITDGGRFGDNKWYGRVERDGTLKKGNDFTDKIGEILAGLALDPAKFASAHGRETGQCCFCALTLTDPRSIKVGFGPICAEKYGLAWG